MSQIFDLQLEQYLLSGILQHPNTFPDIDGFITETDFKNKLHQTIWNVIKRTLRAGEQIDKVIIAQKIDNLALSFEDKISSVGDYLEGLTLINTKEESVKLTANELKTVSIRRNIAHTGEEIAEAMYQHTDLDADQVVALSNKIYTKVVNTFKPKNEPVDLFRGAEEYIRSLEDDTPSDEIVCPYKTYQSFFGGYFPGDLTLFASAPKSGKSTLLANMMKKICEYKEENIKGLIIDTELETYRVQRRMISSISSVNEYLIKSKKWRKNKILYEKVEKALEEMKNYFDKIDHIYVGNITTDEMISIVKRWHWKNIDKNKNKAIVAIDYFKLTGTDNITDAFASSMSLGMRVDSFKKLASELQIPIIGAVQTNRSNQVGLSHEVNKFVSSLFLFERKTKEEMERDNFDAIDKENATHKLVPLYTRDLGELAEKYNEFVEYANEKDGKKNHVPNYISFKLQNFNVIEVGDLHELFRVKDNKLKFDKEKSSVKEVMLK
jgi:replicative DNA helicase